MPGKGLTSLWAYAVGGRGVLKGIEFIGKTVKYKNRLSDIRLKFTLVNRTFHATNRGSLKLGSVQRCIFFWKSFALPPSLKIISPPTLFENHFPHFSRLYLLNCIGENKWILGFIIVWKNLPFDVQFLIFFLLENIYPWFSDHLWTLCHVKCLNKMNKDFFLVVWFILPFFDNFLVFSVAAQYSAQISGFSSQKPVWSSPTAACQHCWKV